jgi:anti-sigma regulatory factor (Ser/Thr protein kinase)
MNVIPHSKQNARPTSLANVLARLRDSSNRRFACSLLRSSGCAAREARQLVTRKVSDWQLSEHRNSELELIVTELVGNAIRHAGHVTGMEISYHPATSVLRIGIVDESSQPPRLQIADGGLDESGRGLQLVEACADGWGHDVYTASPGKTVWAEVRLP